MAAARVFAGRRAPRASLAASMVLWSLLSMAPDADVIGFSFGVRYDDAWGHRGATHSIAVAVLCGAALGAVARTRGKAAWRTALLATAVVASHGLLDTLTDGGRGIALLWPFDDTRYFAPWNPIPVSPIGLGFVSARGLKVASTELVLFAPVFAFALWPRRREGE
jgi:inner membrane protein